MLVGQNITADNANWTFGGEVPGRFVEHITQPAPRSMRSVISLFRNEMLASMSGAHQGRHLLDHARPSPSI